MTPLCRTLILALAGAVLAGCGGSGDLAACEQAVHVRVDRRFAELANDVPECRARSASEEADCRWAVMAPKIERSPIPEPCRHP